MSDYRICNQCVMDTVGNPEITFDDNGVCNYCHEYKDKARTRLLPLDKREQAFNEISNKIKNSGKRYDCLIGVSGGVDSTYTAYLVKSLGLNPLAVHFDNGWNSELAVHNIQKTLEKLNIDLHTFVIDWEEFKDIQLSFLKASTPDGEIPTDHAILATLYKVASKYGIKYIISGNNFKTEGVMPRLWAYGHIDVKYLKSVHHKFGSKPFKSFPFLPISKFLWHTLFSGIKLVNILNYIDYNKDKAMEVLQNKLGWQYYGGKHYESVYTKFYQGYILPRKFGIDKRKLHLSALILSGEILRGKAIEELKQPIYPIDQVDEDREYVIKKFNISETEFDEIMKTTPKSFMDYNNNYDLHEKLRSLLNTLRQKKLYYS